MAALYVDAGGVYSTLPRVDCWGVERDARRYSGKLPVVAHPPCARWGKYAAGSPTRKLWEPRDDGGCVHHAVSTLRRVGGVLEHPAGSQLWDEFGLNRPPHYGGWVNADFLGGWTCAIEQGHFGHVARKPTWLLYYGPLPPVLTWGRSSAIGAVEVLSRKQREATPVELAVQLVALARLAR